MAPGGHGVANNYSASAQRTVILITARNAQLPIGFIISRILYQMVRKLPRRNDKTDYKLLAAGQQTAVSGSRRSDVMVTSLIS